MKTRPFLQRAALVASCLTALSASAKSLVWNGDFSIAEDIGNVGFVRWVDRVPTGTPPRFWVGAGGWTLEKGAAATVAGVVNRRLGQISDLEKFALEELTGPAVKVSFDWTPNTAAGAKAGLNFWLVGYKLTGEPVNGSDLLRLNSVAVDGASVAEETYLMGTGPESPHLVPAIAGETLKFTHTFNLPTGVSMADFDLLGIRFGQLDSNGGSRLDNISVTVSQSPSPDR